MAAKKGTFGEGNKSGKGRPKGSKNKFSLREEMEYKGQVQRIFNEVRKMTPRQLLARTTKAIKSGNLTEISTLTILNDAVKAKQYDVYAAQIERMSPPLKATSIPNDEDWSNEAANLIRKDLTLDDLRNWYIKIVPKAVGIEGQFERLTQFYESTMENLRFRDQIEYGRNNAVPVKILNEVLQAVNDAISIALANSPREIEKFNSVYSKKIESILGDNLEDEPEKPRKKPVRKKVKKK